MSENIQNLQSADVEELVAGGIADDLDVEIELETAEASFSNSEPR